MVVVPSRMGLEDAKKAGKQSTNRMALYRWWSKGKSSFELRLPMFSAFGIGAHLMRHQLAVQPHAKEPSAPSAPLMTSSAKYKAKGILYSYSRGCCRI
jgi:hypothetical protein